MQQVSLHRRTFLKLTAGLGAFAAGSGVSGLLSQDDFIAQARVRGGSQALPLPVVQRGELKDGVRTYSLTVREGRHAFVAGARAATIGVNGNYLGPVLRMRQGEKVRIRVRNALRETTTVHWHGMHLPARMDGGPHQQVKPGQTWEPAFEVRQPAATLWYHAHPHKRTGLHVWKGLAGPIIIDDEEADALPLPREYGVDDIVLVLQDRLFGRDGELVYVQSMHDVMMGMEGDIALCNGVFMPAFEARRQRLRLRILNGANASFYNIGFSDNRPFHVIATDGGLLPRPVERRRVLITPGERVEIVVEVGSEPFFLVSGGAAGAGESSGRRGGGGMMGGGMMGGGMMGRGMGGMMGGRSSVDLPPHTFLHIMPAERLEASPPLPERLVALPQADARKADRVRRFDLQMGMGPMMMMGARAPFAINGKAMDMNVINEVVPLNSTEIWEIRNRSPMPHPFHVHDVQFRVLTRNGRPVPAHEAGRKDTVLVDGGDVVRVLARFEDYADEKHPYMYHCHILEHEDAGMMGQFTVVG